MERPYQISPSDARTFLSSEQIFQRAKLLRYQKVAIGSNSLKPNNLNILYPYIKKLYDNGIYIHLFGTASFDLIANLPASSCDVSTWSKSPGQSMVLYWNPDRTKTNKTERLYFKDKYPFKYNVVYFEDHPERGKITEYWQDQLGITYQDLMGQDWIVNRKLVNLLYFDELEKKVTEIQQSKGFYV